MTSWRLAAYAAKDGEARAGLVVEDRVLDLATALKAHAKATGKPLAFSGATTRSVLENWTKARPMLTLQAMGPSI